MADVLAGRPWVVLAGDVRARLAELAPESVHMACCSPPFYGLRAYGTNPQLWGGDDACDHTLVDGAPVRLLTGGTGAASAKQLTNAGSQFGNAFEPIRAPWANEMPGPSDNVPKNGASRSRLPTAGAVCSKCGCWAGELGSEDSVERFIANLVLVFQAVKRVLRNDGTLWVNLGSSYAGSGKGPTGHNGIGDQERRQGFSTSKGARIGSQHGESGHTSGVTPPAGYKAKDLMQIPALVFHALQQDGWWLRSVAPWIKRNGMPESCTDRPTHSLEWIGLFSKSATYFWDAEAGRVAQSDGSLARWSNGGTRVPGGKSTASPNGLIRDAATERGLLANGRNRRNTDWYFDALDAEIATVAAELAALRALRANGGVRLGDDGLPLAFDVNPAGFPGSHFATWPPSLVKPMIAMSTSERGCCAACQAPWRRITERVSHSLPVAERHGRVGHNGSPPQQSGWFWKPPDIGVTEWQPTCQCDAGEPIPCTVLDPFAGSGTTLLVARRLGRWAIGVELQPEYVQMAEARIASDAPLFETPPVAEPASVAPMLFDALEAPP